MRKQFSVEKKEILLHMSAGLDQMKKLRKFLLERPAFLWEIWDKESTRVNKLGSLKTTHVLCYETMRHFL